MLFDKVKRNFGFGCMRLAMKDDMVDLEIFGKMVDAFMAAGFNYFDTAHCYLDGKSEDALRICLAEKYDREDFVLANKLTHMYFNSEEDVVPFFESQLKLCGVDYFDVYFFHCMTKTTYPHHQKCNTFKLLQQLKQEGKIKYLALSFHSTADYLDKILTENPFIDFVQLQINYLDYDDPFIQSKACYDVAVKHGKKVIVMEPVKGGTLVNLPKPAAEIFDALGGGSYASYALRYAASFPEVKMVLSGMGNMDMMNDNINTFKDFKPLTPAELEACEKAREAIKAVNQISCTGCDYCAAGCPKGIKISKIFANFNKTVLNEMTCDEALRYMENEGMNPSECINCGACAKECPQSLEIPSLLKKVYNKFNY